ncbi:MAG: type II toxin-antitoxin system CcdA family antitoxin [Candidatus Thiothrix moscowensis]|nr:type II toxin-antitoxin system CcdA family antitoxin [Candidatus Thiothrix moscowensis]
MQTLATNSAILHELRHLPLNQRQEVLDFIQFLRSRAETAHKTPVEKSNQKVWLVHNLTALNAYNERIEQRGVFSDGLRLF